MIWREFTMKSADLKEMLKDSDPYVRRDACNAVSDAKDPGLIPELVAVLRDENPGVKEAALNALISIGSREVAEAVSPMLKSDEAAVRNVAIEILQQVGAPGLDILTSMLTDQDDDVVKFAVDIIAGIKEAEGVKLLGPLVKHTNPNVRGSVAVCLGRIEAEGAASILLELLGDSEQWVQFSAVEGLGFLKDPIAVAPLLELIENEEGLVREAAIDAVSRVAGHDEAMGVLNKIGELISDGHVISPAPVVDLLKKATAHGSARRLRPGLEKTYYNFFSSAMEKSDIPTSLLIIRGLSYLHRPEGLEKIFNFTDSLKEINEDTRAELVDCVVTTIGHRFLPPLVKSELMKLNKCFGIIVDALGILRREDAVPILEELMHRAGKEDLRHVASAIEAIGSVESVNVLYNALKSVDGHVRKTAARALATLAGESAVPALFDLLKSEEYRDVQEDVTDVLSLVPSIEVKERFCALLHAPESVMREMGARGLGMIGDEQVLDHLKKAASDSEPAVRKAAYKSMAKLGIPDAIEHVIEGLHDTHDDVKLSVLKALGGWNGDRIRTALLDVVKDENLWVRYQAVNLLGDMEDASTQGVLEQLLINDEPPIKAAAAMALGKCGCTESLEVLERFCEHPDPKVMQAVHESIESLRCLL